MISETEQFMREFLAIDKDNSGFVDRAELQDYYTGCGHEQEKIDKWMERFDQNKDGKITMKEFTRALNVDEEEMEDIKQQVLEEERGILPEMDPGVKVIKSSMTVKWQKAICDKFKDLVDEKVDFESIAGQMREFLHKRFKPTWQVIVIEGSYAMNNIHDPFYNICVDYQGKKLLASRMPHRG